MAHINRRYIDKHWLMFVVRGVMAAVFGCITLFGGVNYAENLDWSSTGAEVMVLNMISLVSIFLLFMGIVDSVGALYSSTKKRGWINSVIDAVVDVVAAVGLLFFAGSNLVNGLIILGAYTIISGIIDIFHGFLSTVDPTDRFIRILAGVSGCVIGAVIFNAWSFEIMTFIRFFGVYLLIVGITSMVYGVHNRAQKVEDTVARKEARKTTKKSAKKTTKKRK